MERLEGILGEDFKIYLLYTTIKNKKIRCFDEDFFLLTGSFSNNGLRFPEINLFRLSNENFFSGWGIYRDINKDSAYYTVNAENFFLFEDGKLYHCKILKNGEITCMEEEISEDNINNIFLGVYRATDENHRMLTNIIRKVLLGECIFPPVTDSLTTIFYLSKTSLKQALLYLFFERISGRYLDKKSQFLRKLLIYSYSGTYHMISSTIAELLEEPEIGIL